MQSELALLRARKDGDLSGVTFDASTTGPGSAFLVLMLWSERGMVPLPEVIARVRDNAWHGAMFRRYVDTAEALAAGDDTRLAAAIDAAEADGLVVHAARMRLVLAERTGDRAQLDRARSILGRLSDRQHLRRLEEIAAARPA
jgi:hypothetical protein